MLVDTDVNCGSASISDINGDNLQEIVVSSKGSYGSQFTTVFNKNGLVATLDFGDYKMTPALAKINTDSFPDIIVGGIDGVIRAYDMVHERTLWQTETEGPINSSPAIGNINPLPIFPGSEIAFGNDSSKVWAIRAINGYPVSFWPHQTGGLVQTSAALANLDGTAGLEIVVGANDQYIYALNYAKDPIAPYPLPVFGLPSSPIIGDIDRDGYNEIIVSSGDGYLHIWRNIARSEPAYTRLAWPQVHHDYQRTGNYDLVK